MADKKVDVSKLSAQEKMIYEKYGKLPTRKDLVSHKLKERKYFDSGDYALYKAGKPAGPGGGVGSVIPSPDMIPHSNPNSTNHQPANPHNISSTTDTQSNASAEDSTATATK